MTELIVDAIEFVKNPYKGKKLKVRPGSDVVVMRSLTVKFRSLLTYDLSHRLTQTSPRNP